MEEDGRWEYGVEVVVWAGAVRWLRLLGKKQSGGFTALSFLPLLSLPQTYFLFPNQAARC